MIETNPILGMGSCPLNLRRTLLSIPDHTQYSHPHHQPKPNIHTNKKIENSVSFDRPQPPSKLKTPIPPSLLLPSLLCFFLSPLNAPLGFLHDSLTPWYRSD